MIRIEASLKKFKESVEKRFDQLINIFIGIVAAFAGIVAVTIGFAIWDFKRSQTLEEREEMLEKILKEYAKNEPKLAEVMKRMGFYKGELPVSRRADSHYGRTG